MPRLRQCGVRFHIAALLAGIALQLTFGRLKGISDSDFQIRVFVVVHDQLGTGNAQVDPNFIRWILPVMMRLGFDDDLAALMRRKGVKLAGFSEWWF